MTMIYLAQPIDQADTSIEWAYGLNRALANCEARVQVYNPLKAFQTQGPDPRVQDVNNAALDLADVLVALVPSATPTLGVPVEIERAVQRGIPVGIVTDLVYSTQISHWNDRGARVLVAPRKADVQIQSLIDTLIQSAAQVPPVAPLHGDLLFEQLDAGVGRLPSRAHLDDAGLDLYVSRSRWVDPGQFVDVPAGVAVALPADCWGLIIGRSSVLRRGLLVQQGVIDPGWRGELSVMVLNTSTEGVRIEQGERLGQLVLMPNKTAQFRPTWSTVGLPAGSRGLDGFGSSGR